MILNDFSHLFNRGVHANKDKILENLSFNAHVTLTMLLNAAKRFGASKQNPFVIAVDSKPTWRKAYYDEHTKQFPEYKETKDGREVWKTYKGNRVKDPTIPWDEIYKMNDEILAVLKKHSDFFVVEVPECEADDIVAVLAKDCKARGEQCWIIANDKDFKQLQDEPLITLFDPIKQAFIPAMDKDKVLQLHLITGDKSDNIISIKPRHGEKSQAADKLLPLLKECLASDPQARARYEFNRAMIDFNYIPQELQDKILSSWNAQEHSYNAGELIKLFRKYRLLSLIENIHDFKLSEKAKVTPSNQYHVKQQELSSEVDKGINKFFGDDDDD
jgi:5'-3' exonuclease, N-terminal resolvase-like domain/T4 RNase H, C terminal